MARCKSCGAEIKFIKLSSGKMSPVEIKTTKIWHESDGKYFLVEGHESHFANCPDANFHRKPKIENQDIGPLQTRGSKNQKKWSK